MGPRKTPDETVTKRAKKRGRRKQAPDAAAPVAELARVYRTPPPLPVRREVEPAQAPDTWPAQSHPSAALVTVRYSLLFTDGQQVQVSGDGVVGRNPRRDGAYVHVIKVSDTHRMLSREHFEFGLTADHQFWAADLGSTNGTFALTGQDQQLLAPHQRTAIAAGSTILFGDSAATVVGRA
ncbi:FHA domain-containing protein [Sanguibacter suarezii]|uniref:FHA domain-containing protein n=1 Tax=Sanguibacter suarezii TaxID=60921 RepID=UPI00082A9B27|nr:FHA domain-containing protein [Sanguibacter suarezii]